MTNPYVPPVAPERPSPQSIRPMSMGAAAGWVFLVTMLFALGLAFLFKSRPDEKSDEIAGFACQAIAFLVGLFGILRVYGPDVSIREFVGLRRTSWLFFPIAIGLGVATTIAADLLYTVITHRWPLDEGPSLLETLRAASRVKRVIICVVIAAAGPFVEELLFRGALFRPQKRANGAWVTVVVTSILFTLIHLSWQKFPPLILLALCLGAVREWSGSLWASWAFHAAFNAVGVASAVIELNTGNPFDIPDAYQVQAAVASAVAAALLLFAAKLVADRSASAASARALDS